MTTVTVLALVITVVLRLFVAEAFYVPSESMYDTLTTDDRILAEKVSYLHRDVDRGDIIVFKDPGELAERGAGDARSVAPARRVRRHPAAQR